MSGSTTMFTRGEYPLRADKLNTAFSERLLRSGDQMTGSLLLARDPQIWNEAATKQYTDSKLGNVVGMYLPLSGGTLTGPLTLASDPIALLHPASKQYVDVRVVDLTHVAMDDLATVGAFGLAGIPSPDAIAGVSSWNSHTGDVIMTLADITGVGGLSAATAAGLYLPLTGGTLSGPLTINAAVRCTNLDVGSLSAVGPAFTKYHSSGTGSDYDTIWYATGGSVVAGSGTLSFFGAQLTVNSPLTTTGNITAQGNATTQAGGVLAYRNAALGGGVGSLSNAWGAGFATTSSGVLQWGNIDNSGNVISNRMSLDAAGNLVVTGNISTGLSISATNTLLGARVAAFKTGAGAGGTVLSWDTTNGVAAGFRTLASNGQLEFGPVDPVSGNLNSIALTLTPSGDLGVTGQLSAAQSVMINGSCYVGYGTTFGGYFLTADSTNCYLRFVSLPSPAQQHSRMVEARGLTTLMRASSRNTVHTRTDLLRLCNCARSSIRSLAALAAWCILLSQVQLHEMVRWLTRTVLRLQTAHNSSA
jgi:hypothetical protein